MYIVWWIIAVVVECLAGFALIFYALSRAASANLRRHESESAMLNREHDDKTEMLEKLASFSVRLIRHEYVDALKGRAYTLAEDLKTEENRAELTKSELAAQENRLRELDEIERELEISNFEAAKELAELRAEEERIADRNLELRKELNDSLGKIDRLLVELKHSKEAVEKLNRTKSELVAAEEKIDWFEREITEINGKYAMMKNSYDALDIEYAQLYEKQGPE